MWLPADLTLLDMVAMVPKETSSGYQVNGECSQELPHNANGGHGREIA